MTEIGSPTKNAPLVSVICTTYNHEAYIKDCIEGFLMQRTDFSYEVLVHDDASNDCTLCILKDYKKKYPDIIRLFVEQENQYHKQDITKLMKHFCRGKYIAFCEGDDYWIDPFKLQRGVNLFRNNPGMTLCFSNRNVKNELNGRLTHSNWKLRRYTVDDFLAGFNPGVQTEMILSDSLTDDDFDFGWQHHINGDRIIPICSAQNGFALLLPNVTATYRVTGKGVSTSLSKNYSAKQWFNHAINDLYNLHEAFLFPSKKAYIKSITAYTFNYIRKSGNLFYGISKASHYGSENRASMICSVCISEFKYLFGRLNLYVSLLFERINNVFRNLLITHQFSSKIFEIELDSLFDIRKAKHIKSFKTPRINIGNREVTIADAFIYSNNERLSLYYELQNSYQAKGLLIETHTLDGHKWSNPTIALEEDCHLSFPNVFDMDGETWMLPETFMKKQIRLYRKEASSNNFVLASVLIEGGKYVDSFIYKKDGVYYLFTSLQYDDNSYDLKLYYSDELSGNYIEHPSSPISHGKAYQRNAGSMIEVNNKMFRPAQECTAYYGQNVHIMEVQELSKDVYREVPYMLDIIPQAKGFGIGGHQFSTCVFKGKRIVAIDILHKSINTHILFTRLLKKIGKR